MYDGETEGFARLVTGWGKLLGAHIIGPDAGNYIAEAALALRKGMKAGDLSRTVHVYPVLSEIVEMRADACYRQKLFTQRNQKIFSAVFALRRRLTAESLLLHFYALRCSVVTVSVPSGNSTTL